MPPSTDAPDRVNQVVSRIEGDAHLSQFNPHKLLHELNDLRRADSSGGKVDRAAFKTDLAQVTQQLHKDGVLPQLDLVESQDSKAALRGVSVASTSPLDGSPSLVSKAHGTTFTYDNQGHVASWSKGSDSWRYSAADGKYHEYDHGQKTGKSTSDVVSMSGNGTETVTHADGSSSTIAPWGGKIDRNAAGLMTRESSHKSVKTFQYENGQLSGMSVQLQGKGTVDYEKSADGKFYKSSDHDHSNPLDIEVDAKRAGVVHITDKNGATTDQLWGGTNVHWDKDHQLTSIDYDNGNKATNFSYDENHQLTGFSMSGKDGKTHKYSCLDGMVSVDGSKGMAGELSVTNDGRLSVNVNGDGSDQQYKLIQFGMGGSQTESGKFGDRILPVEVTSNSGKISSFKYDATGNLTEVDARGYRLHKSGSQWLDANGKPADVTPIANANGSFSVVHSDGTYETWTAGGTKTEGIPDTPEAIAKEAKQAKDAADNATTSDGLPDVNLQDVPGDKSFASKIVRDAIIVAQRMHSHGLCLKGVATALDMAGGGYIHGGAAWMAADRLARDKQFHEVPKNTNLQPGDIVVHGCTASNPFGHILVYLGHGEEASDSIAPLTNMNYGQWTRVFRPTG